MRPGTALPLMLLLGACSIQAENAHRSPCLDGGSSCAAAQAPAGMRQVLKSQDGENQMDGDNQQRIRRARYWRQGGVESDHSIPLINIQGAESNASKAKECQNNDEAAYADCMIRIFALKICTD